MYSHRMSLDLLTGLPEWIWVCFDIEPLFPISQQGIVEWGDSILVDL
jgi:hypothetical protein